VVSHACAGPGTAPRPLLSPAGGPSAVPALSVVAVGGDADLTDLPCSRSPAAWSSVLGRRSPRAARSLLRKPPVRSWTCGASSGRRLMAPASLHNNHEAARADPEGCATDQIAEHHCR